MLRILLAPLVLVAQLGSVHAENVVRTVGETDLNLVVPSKFCVLDQNNYRDAIFIAVVTKLLQGMNKLILLTADCNILAKWRGGDNSPMSQYAMYYVPNSVEKLTLPGDPHSLRQGLCRDMRKQGGATLDQAKEIIAKKAQEMSANISVSGTNFIGVVDEDDHGCYAALVVNVKDAAGKNIVISSLITSTVIRSKPIFFAIYDPYVNSETTQHQVRRSKTIAADLDRANK